MKIFAMAFRAAMLDRKVYTNIQEDQESMRRAIAVVITAAIAFGVGARISTPADFVIPDAQDWMITIGIQNLVMLSAISTVMLSWVSWSAIAYYVGSVLLRGKASYRVTIRAMGLCYAPVALLLFTPIIHLFPGGRLEPFMFLSLIGWWLLATATIAIKEIGGLDWLRITFPALFGWIGAWFFLIQVVSWQFISPAFVPLVSQ